MLNVGDKAPDFSLPASTGETISLKDLKGSRVVLYFYPKDDTPGCTREACSFRDRNDELISSGIKVLGVSADSVKSHRDFSGKFNLPFPLLSDEDRKAIEEYGVWGQRQVRGRTVMGIRRMTYLIDQEGTIRQIWTNVTPDNHAQEILEAAEELG
ncbi:MAG TPA: thioredoxin-dependent thiol peroxidase [Dehalococcoidia bacterium]|jgi:peroxiredoxin Q/BCP|nr:thioredoxin-dependent thiol peroxidase [Dehalococcoidia bacterium]